jgi:ATP-binding cassette subfamily B protein
MHHSTVACFLKEIVKPFKAYLLVFAFVSILRAIELSLQPFIIKLLIDQVNEVSRGQFPIASIAKPIGIYLCL